MRCEKSLPDGWQASAVSAVGAAASAGGKSCRTHSGTGLCIDGTGERNSAGGRAGRRSAADGMMAKLMTVLLAAEQLESGAWTLETVLDSLGTW